MTEKQIAGSIPSEYRRKIILEWLPAARPSMASDEFRILWEMYFIYVDSNAIKKADCPQCLSNVLNNWRHLAKVIAEVERDYNLIESL